jgi:hypothetical protein
MLRVLHMRPGYQRPRHVRIGRRRVKLPMYSDLDLLELRTIGVHNYQHPRHPCRNISRDPNVPWMIRCGSRGMPAWFEGSPKYGYRVAVCGEAPIYVDDARQAYRLAHRLARVNGHFPLL